MSINIGVLISGGGTNLQSVIDATISGQIEGKVTVVLSDKNDAYGLERAKKHQIDRYVLPESDRNKMIIELLQEYSVDLVVLAGYLKILSPAVIQKYNKRIINIHPALIPAYCGKGFYGMKVHEAVIKNKESKSGATVHLVDEGVDTGPILKQKEVAVEKDDTPESLAKKVLKIEHEILVSTIEEISKGAIDLESIN